MSNPLATDTLDTVVTAQINFVDLVDKASDTGTLDTVVTAQVDFVDLVARRETRVSVVGAYAELTTNETRVSVVGVYAELTTNEVRASQVGAYAELERNEVRVSQVGAYAELNTVEVRASTVGAYAELDRNDVRTSTVGAYAELDTVEVRASAVGAYAELEVAVVLEDVRASTVGAYAELTGSGAGGGSLLVTAVGVYVETDTAVVDVTMFGAYAEIESNTVWVSTVGAYVEICLPCADPVDVLPNGGMRANGVKLYYGSSLISRYVKSFELTSAVRGVTAGNFTADYDAQTPGLAQWTATLRGMWDTGLDDIFGEEIAQRGHSEKMVSFRVLIGPRGSQVQYMFAQAFVTHYNVKANVDDLMVWEATLAMGYAFRSSRDCDCP